MANSLLAKGTRVRYDAEDFPKYYRQLRGLCLKSKGAWVLSKIVRNPITKFESRVAYLCTQTTAKGSTPETESTQKATTRANEPENPTSEEAPAENNKTPQSDNSKTLFALATAAPNTSLNYPKGKWPTAPGAPSDAALKADPPEIAYQFNAEVNRANIGTAQIRETLENELCNWIEAEGIIYAITIETLVDAPQFIIATEGAGRAQLQHLIDLHQGHTKRATQTLIKIYHDFRYLTGPPPEGLSRYFQRLPTSRLHSYTLNKSEKCIANHPKEQIVQTMKCGYLNEHCTV